MMRKAAALYDAGDDLGAGGRQHGEVRGRRGVREGGGPGRRTPSAATASPREFGLARLIAASRVARIAPVSREMILNDVSHQTLGLPKSY